MRCEEARERLLTCEPGELAGEAETRLVEHLRGCRACRETAAALLERERALARALDGAVSMPEDRALEHALAGREEGDGAEGLRYLWRVAVPLAAAAALVLLWVLPLGEPSGDAGPVPGPTVGAAAGETGPTATRLAVHVKEGRQVAVIETRDPQVTVVWFHGETERRTP